MIFDKHTGPIIRVNPEELSIQDGAFYTEIYCSENKRRTNNYSHFGKGIDFDGIFPQSPIILRKVDCANRRAVQDHTSSPQTTIITDNEGSHWSLTSQGPESGVWKQLFSTLSRSWRHA